MPAARRLPGLPAAFRRRAGGAGHRAGRAVAGGGRRGQPLPEPALSRQGRPDPGLRQGGVVRPGRLRLRRAQADGDLPLLHGHAVRHRPWRLGQPHRARRRRGAERTRPADPDAARDAILCHPSGEHAEPHPPRRHHHARLARLLSQAPAGLGAGGLHGGPGAGSPGPAPGAGDALGGGALALGNRLKQVEKQKAAPGPLSAFLAPQTLKGR